MSSRYDVLALFSGGLDSILSCKVMQGLGLSVLGLHFLTPFFGKPERIKRWQATYGIDIAPVDVSEAYVRMLADPPHGWGKALNPCVDCKVLMLAHAKSLMAGYGAKILISGEVVGQRPMSQRRDALHIISREAGVRDVLLRPLCAKHMEITAVEQGGLVDRERLLDFAGRGRKGQLALAEAYGITDIPTPAGGCCLTEPEAAARFWMVFRQLGRPTARDFRLASVGRQYWAGGRWLAVGRNESENRRLEALAGPEDILFKTRSFPGPLALGRPAGEAWDPEAVRDAAAFVASFSPKAVRVGGPSEVSLTRDGRPGSVLVAPQRRTALGWAEPDLAQFKVWKAGSRAS